MRQLLPHQQQLADPIALAASYAWPAPFPNRPWVRVNFAHAVDGSLTDANGLSAGVSNPADKRIFALLRATTDAVLVGAGTARAEDYGPVSVRPEFEHVRAGQGRTGEPQLIVVSRTAQLSERTRLAATVLAPDDRGMRGLLEDLFAQGVQRVLCEGGAHLFTQLLQANLVDDMCLTTTPCLIGSPTTRLVTDQLPHPQHTELAGLIEDSGTLFARWLVKR